MSWKTGFVFALGLSNVAAAFVVADQISCCPYPFLSSRVPPTGLTYAVVLRVDYQDHRLDIHDLRDNHEKYTTGDQEVHCSLPIVRARAANGIHAMTGKINIAKRQIFGEPT